MTAGPRSLGVAALLAVASGCGGATPESAPRAAAPDSAEPALAFSFRTTDGQVLSHATTRGRSTALVFITTYDAASQLEVKALELALRAARPRANGAAVILETAQYGLLADVFRTTLNLSYPVALADEATLQGHGPFGKIEIVPTTVVLDRWSRVRFRHAGLLGTEPLRVALEAAAKP